MKRKVSMTSIRESEIGNFLESSKFSLRRAPNSSDTYKVEKIAYVINVVETLCESGDLYVDTTFDFEIDQLNDVIKKSREESCPEYAKYLIDNISRVSKRIAPLYRNFQLSKLKI